MPSENGAAVQHDDLEPESAPGPMEEMMPIAKVSNA
jgi:hypothetical protein